MFLSAFVSCKKQIPYTNTNHTIDSSTTKIEKPKIGELEKKIQEMGFVKLDSLEPNLFFDIRYSTTNNFTKQDMYGDLNTCYLHPIAADEFVKACNILKAKHPHLRFLIFDGLRPHSVQKIMYDEYRKMNVAQGKYVSHPQFNSIHNYGCAIDLTLCDSNGIALPMGTEYDYFGPEAHTNNEAYLVSIKKITEEELNNRKILRSVMKEAGFTTVQFEWWHFNSCSREYAKTNYKLLE